MINDLEDEWGVTLLERNRTGLRLTFDGINIYPYVKIYLTNMNLCRES